MVHEFRSGDKVELVVSSPDCLLPIGRYECEISAVAEHSKELKRVTVLYLNFMPPHVKGRQAHVMFTIYHNQETEGHGFLGKDRWPVRYIHAQNLEKRLEDSLK